MNVFDTLQISVGEIGAISKIRLQHDNTGDNPAWHVKSVSILISTFPDFGGVLWPSGLRTANSSSAVSDQQSVGSSPSRDICVLKAIGHFR